MSECLALGKLHTAIGKKLQNVTVLTLIFVEFILLNIL